MKTRPFLICSLPASRTMWLSHFMTGGDVACYWELAGEAASLNDFAQHIECIGSRFTGNADAWQAAFIPSLLKYLDDPVIVVVERPTAAVLESYGHLVGRQNAEVAINTLLPHLDWIKRALNPMVIPFGDLDSEDGIRAVWNHCTRSEMEFPCARWRMWKVRQVQIHPRHFSADFNRKKANIMALQAEHESTF